MAFTLTNCGTGQIITTTSNLEDYENMTVILEDYEGCWEVKTTEPSVLVVVTDSFKSCKFCLPNCFNSDCR